VPSTQVTTWSQRSARASSVRMPTSRLSTTYACSRVGSAAASRALASSSVRLLDGRPLRPCGTFTSAATLRMIRSLDSACRIARSSEFRVICNDRVE
jgi:hypothetical protein